MTWLHYMKLRAEAKKQRAEATKMNFFGARYVSVIEFTFAILHPQHMDPFPSRRLHGRV
jgi:hypothetical protein